MVTNLLLQCVFDSLTDSNVCCGATDMGVCTDGEKASSLHFDRLPPVAETAAFQAYLNAIDMSVRECLINEPNSCPTNYLCRFNPTKNRYFCCGSTKSSHCPPGRAPYKDQMSLQAMRCTMNAHVSTCPDGFECQSDIRDALQGYCCSVSDICPNKEDYFVDEASAMPRSCSVGHFVTCPSGYTCMTQFEGVNGYCCRGQTHLGVSDGCPPGEIVFMDKNEIAKCDPFNPSNHGCPNGFTCQWSIRTQRYQCCGANPVPSSPEGDGCPSRQVAFIDGATSKPQVAFIGISGEHQRCSMTGGQSCPEGFICVKGKRNEEICCAGGEDSYVNECPDKDTSKSAFSLRKPQCVVDGRCLLATIGFPCDIHLVVWGCSCEIGLAGCRSYHEEAADIVLLPKGCDSNQVLHDNECLPMVALGRACVITVQCRGAGECADGVCNCPTGTIRKVRPVSNPVLLSWIFRTYDIVLCRVTIAKESLAEYVSCAWLHSQQLMEQPIRTSSIRLQQKTQVSVWLPDYRIVSTGFPYSALQGSLVQKASLARTHVQCKTIFAAQISFIPRTT
ncbi:EB module, partial [Ostertagia ostertagi]